MKNLEPIDRTPRDGKNLPNRSIFPAGFVLVFGLLTTPGAQAQDIDPASGNALPYPGTQIGGYQLAWSDEFNGTAVDTSKWDYRTDTRYWSKQLAANVSESSGILNLNLKKETIGTTNYTAGGVISKKLFRYGYYEARMKFPPGRGWHSSFWMYKNNRPATDTVAIELDAIENDSINPLTYSVNVHRHLPTPHVTFGTKAVYPPSLSANFHVIGCEFTPTVVNFFLDGVLVQTVSATQFPHEDVNIWLSSLAAPLSGTTSVDDTLLPAAAQFDYVRFFTPGSINSMQIVSPGVGGATLPDTASLLHVKADVAVSDPSKVPNFLWSKVSGPGTITFADPAAAQTTVSFSAAGCYVFQCEASLGTSRKSATATAAVNAPLTISLRQGVQGYSHTATFIRGDTVDQNSGGRDQLILGRWRALPLRGLFSFDLSSLSRDSLIQSAVLNVWTAPMAGTGTISAINLHRLLNTPVEGTGDGVSVLGTGSGASWKSRTGGTATSDLWTSPGGDFNTAVLSSVAGFDAALMNKQKTFASTSSFVAAAQDAVSTPRPLNLLLRSPVTETATAECISRLSSDDDGITGQRPQLTLTFKGNYTPTITTGPAPKAAAGTYSVLAGTVSNAKSSSWSKLSGPGTVIFDQASAARTSAVFSKPGTYLLELSAANDSGESGRTLGVTAISQLDSWRLACFGTTTETSTSADNADPNHDGEINLIEFATGQSPTAATTEPGVLVQNGAYFEFTYPRARVAVLDNVQFLVEWSENLASWSSAGVTQLAISGTDNGTTQLWKALVPVGASGRCFVRLRVSK